MIRPALILAAALAASAAGAVMPPPDEAAPDQDRVLGEQLVRQGRFSLSIPFLIEATKRDPMVADLHVYLAFALRNEGRREEAAAHYRFALRLEPENRWALAYYGVLLLETGHRSEAEAMHAALERVCASGCPEREELERAFSARS
jgi:Flp pilus assembly protein TadD